MARASPKYPSEAAADTRTDSDGSRVAETSASKRGGSPLKLASEPALRSHFRASIAHRAEQGFRSRRGASVPQQPGRLRTPLRSSVLKHADKYRHRFGCLSFDQLRDHEIQV